MSTDVNITSEDTVLADEGEVLVNLQLVGVLGRNVTVVLYTVDQTATGEVLTQASIT